MRARGLRQLEKFADLPRETEVSAQCRQFRALAHGLDGAVGPVFVQAQQLAGVFRHAQDALDHRVGAGLHLVDVGLGDAIFLGFDQRKDHPLDDEFFAIVKWVISGLIEAEEYGITAANLEQLKAETTDPVVGRIVGKTDDTGKLLGLDREWMVRAIAATGNDGHGIIGQVGAIELPSIGEWFNASNAHVKHGVTATEHNQICWLACDDGLG